MRAAPSLLSRPFIALAALAVCHTAAYGQFNYTETFANSTAAGWNFYTGNSSPGPRLTSGLAPVVGDPEYGVSSVIDPTGQGWLRLATTTANQSNAAYFDTALPSANNNITIKFSVAMWGDQGIATGGDGLTFFMRDASQPFSVGAFGGSIGYAQKTGIDGVSGGYFGVAMDVYGNYSSPTEGRQGGVGAVPNAVVVRGPGTGQTGYNYLSGTGGYNYTATGSPTAKNNGDPAVAALPYSLSFPNATSRPNQTVSYRNVEIDLTGTSQLTVKMQFGEDAVWRTVVTADMSSFARPDMMAFGFSSGTGDANQVYEIGNTFSVTASAASNTFLWDNGAAAGSQGIWGTTTATAANWVGNTNPPTQSNIIFNDSNVSSNQTVTVTGANQTVGSIYFSGKDSYTIKGDNGTRAIVLDATGTGTSSYISLTSAATGNASHAINTNLTLTNALVVENYVADKILSFGGNVATAGNDITVKGPGETDFLGTVSGGGTLTKLDGGLLTFATSGAVSNIVLGGGRLLLDSATLTAGNLHITGNSIIDFGTGGASILNLTSLTIDAGVTLTITDWTNTLDFFNVSTAPTAGALSQIVFAGSTSPTGYQSMQVRPVPEPAAYGSLLVGALVAFFAWYRWKFDQTATRLRPIPVRRREILLERE